MNHVPTHVAIMMDGNGRWGKQRGLTRSQGHFAGSQALEKTIDAAMDLDIKILTIYAFSTENWKRPKAEVDYLMKLPVKFLHQKLSKFVQKDIKLIFSGNISGLPKQTQDAVKLAADETSNNSKLVVNFALNYGGKNEILTAIKVLIDEINHSTISFDDISEETIEKHLFTKDLPHPDLFIRTGGEKRLSNFLLWQLDKTELWFTDIYFPDFNKQLLIKAINEVNQRRA
ncbi:di-trans,poly-cis-decaprenylcistransferase [Sporolactobacillus shoreae]|uniref:Isoprenyl transferase n=1 Tax=Sporolactobacillus shoreae TaxID=1465501 RepID=A0A4Z0GNF2_9BACL|nr:polyprenyl diphosphate synthase [Sporolactobacillus shoreae]TGA97689.1 di-trans,poly-cis-decaprenylcistransferase [Sporolactobacillus shoreae]